MGRLGLSGREGPSRVPLLQSQNRTQSWTSDARSLFPALPITAPPHPQHEFVIRSHSRHKPSKGEAPPVLSDHLAIVSEGLLVLVCSRLPTVGSLSRVTLHQGPGKETPETGGSRTGPKVRLWLPVWETSGPPGKVKWEQ